VYSVIVINIFPYSTARKSSAFIFADEIISRPLLFDTITAETEIITSESTERNLILINE
jgi:hypothetical protein